MLAIAKTICGIPSPPLQVRQDYVSKHGKVRKLSERDNSTFIFIIFIAILVSTCSIIAKTFSFANIIDAKVSLPLPALVPSSNVGVIDKDHLCKPGRCARLRHLFKSKLHPTQDSARQHHPLWTTSSLLPRCFVSRALFSESPTLRNASDWPLFVWLTRVRHGEGMQVALCRGPQPKHPKLQSSHQTPRPSLAW